MPRRKMVFDERLICHVDDIHYDFVLRKGILNLPDCNCCDMKGCVRLFKAIDEQVKIIEVYEAGILDAKYLKHNDGWICVPQDTSPKSDEAVKRYNVNRKKIVELAKGKR